MSTPKKNSSFYEPGESHPYSKPTWKSYDDPMSQWYEWQAQAAELPMSELSRHAHVSIDNRHSCRECFCCAAKKVLRDKLAGKRH